MYSCCAQKGSVQPITSISINTFLLRITLYWQDHYVLTYTDVSPEPSFHGAIITSSDISKCSQPSCTTGKPLTPPRGKKKLCWLERRNISHHHAVWSGELSRLLGAEACIGNTTTCINAQPSLSPASKCFITAKAQTQFRGLYGAAHQQACSLKGKVKHDKLK